MSTPHVNVGAIGRRTNPLLALTLASIAVGGPVSIPWQPRERTEPLIVTKHDIERMEAAERKRQRKANRKR